jgi:hypothetical protein
MPKLLPLAVIATAAALGACSTPPQQTAPRVVTNVIPYTPGNGVVQAVFAAPVGQAQTTSAEPMARLEIKMDNGKVQYVDTTSREFTRGSRVQLTQDRLIKKIG